MPVVVEKALGSTNGRNTVFYTSVSYKPGFLHVHRNGLLLNKNNDDGFNEKTLNKFTMKIAPELNDLIDVLYHSI